MSLLVLLGLGCVKPDTHRPPESPILPAPEASNYAVGESQAKDPFVARVAKGLPWDEALSGAAAGLSNHPVH